MSSSICIELYQWILDNVPAGKAIIELGSGDVSTKLLCQHYDLYSVENDKKFLNRYKSKYIYAPLKKYRDSKTGFYSWYDDTYLRGKLPAEYSAVLVDGPVGSENRVGFYCHLELFNTGVPFVFHDTHRQADRDVVRRVQKRTGKSLVTFDGLEMEVLL
jgi:hypothetical protein